MLPLLILWMEEKHFSSIKGCMTGRGSSRTMPTNLWRRTAFTQIDGAVETPDDDWPLFVDSLPAARIYRVRGGPHDGRWFWAVQIDLGRVPFNSGAGNADGGCPL
jgi:hypothetical protein